MRILSRFRSWFQAVVHRSRWEEEMDDEVRFHIEQQAADLVRGGITPGEASRRARLEFGAIEARKDEMREAVGLRLLNEIGADSGTRSASSASPQPSPPSPCSHSHSASGPTQRSSARSMVSF
jgi:hypothetical protein